MDSSFEYVDVLLPLMVPAAFTYKVPVGMQVGLGDFVKVPLGSKQVCGVVWGQVGDVKNIGKIKCIIERLDVEPLSLKFRKFIDWVANYNVIVPGNVLKMVMSVSEALMPEDMLEVYEVANDNNLQYTSARKKVMDLLKERPYLTAQEIVSCAGVGRSVLKGLHGVGAVRVVHRKRERKIVKVNALNIEYSKQQKLAVDDLRMKVSSAVYSVTVLDGVTGSGKTETYFAAVAEALLKDGAQVLILLPEIALTSQVVVRFVDVFGFEPVQWHSGLTKKQRISNWREISAGRARLVIGARSALFLPYKDLQLIVVDEEHESSYKQEEGAVYHARDMAVLRASIEGIAVILASATPSIETIENVRLGKYSYLKLESRYGGSTLPDVKVVDMRKAGLKGGKWLSPTLQSAVHNNLETGRQSMLFLNRRGYAPLMLCRECGYRFQCPDCSSWLVEHRGGVQQLMCHHCGYSEQLPKKCVQCGKDEQLVSCGPGVERVADEVNVIFPNAKVLVMTSDIMSTQSKTDSMLGAITRGEVDVVVGTQIMAKGHHFPDLTLVGVVDADLGLEGGDLRAAERTYQLLQQVAGRAGREKQKGTVILQSYMPENSVMQVLASGDRDKFIDVEMEGRKMLKAPPYARLAALIISGLQEKLVADTAKDIVRAAPTSEELRVLGPVPAPLYRLRGRYRYRILIHAPCSINIQKWIRNLLANIKASNSVKIKVDIDPYNFM